jgi:hypothetical protein
MNSEKKKEEYFSRGGWTGWAKQSLSALDPDRTSSNS